MRLIEHDRRWAQTLNRASSSANLLLACRVASRLGDGVLWYLLILVLPFIAGQTGWLCSEHMLLARRHLAGGLQGDEASLLPSATVPVMP